MHDIEAQLEELVSEYGLADVIRALSELAFESKKETVGSLLAKAADQTG